jgi:DNA-binding response OmpR family regulator
MTMRKRVLLVDDDTNLLQSLGRILTLSMTPNQWELVWVTNGRDALQQVALTPYDLVITDILMPEHDGLETIQKLRRAFPTIKIIAISGGGRVGKACVLKLATYFGAHWTLAKPFSPEELLVAMRALLLDQVSRE